MSTFSFTRLESGTVKIVNDSNTYFVPGDCQVNANDSLNRIIITDRFGSTFTIDSALDTVNIAGVLNTGTASEIAEDLSNEIFFLVNGGVIDGVIAGVLGSDYYSQAWSGADQDFSTGLSWKADDGYLDMYVFSSAKVGQEKLAIIEAVGDLSVRSRDGNILLPTIDEYIDDAAAAIGGVPVKGLYYTDGILKIRIA